MAADQAAKMIDGVNVRVLHAKTIAQGYASLMAFDETVGLDENFEAMTESIQSVKTGEVTYAVRDTNIGGIEIKANDFMGILDGEIVVSTKERIDATKNLLSKGIDEDSAVVTIFAGNGTSEEEISQIEEYIKTLNEDVECEVVDGKQDIYSYIISIE
jgi:dihydroxyacetone kinase-like predicted kinase